MAEEYQPIGQAPEQFQACISLPVGLLIRESLRALVVAEATLLNRFHYRVLVDLGQRATWPICSIRSVLTRRNRHDHPNSPDRHYGSFSHRPARDGPD